MTPAAAQVTESAVRAFRTSLMQRGGDLRHTTDGALREILAEVAGAGRRIITICGSTRFRAEIAEANRSLTLSGFIVLAPGVFGHDGDPLTDEQKVKLDRLHFEKIDLSSGIYVVNPGGYLGDSTRAEIAYAVQRRKRVLSLKPL